jgi:hypothetical protein
MFCRVVATGLRPSVAPLSGTTDRMWGARPGRRKFPAGAASDAMAGIGSGAPEQTRHGRIGRSSMIHFIESSFWGAEARDRQSWRCRKRFLRRPPIACAWKTPLSRGLTTQGIPTSTYAQALALQCVSIEISISTMRRVPVP